MNALLDGLLDAWLLHLPAAVWQTTVVAVIVLLAIRLGRRAPATWRYGLLAIALGKFAFPPYLSLPSGVFERLTPGPFFAPQATTAASSGFGVGVWLVALHAVGAVVFAAILFRQHRRLKMLEREATEVRSGELFALFESLAARLGLRRRPRLLISDDAPGPLAFSLWRPNVVIPRRLVTTLSDDEIRMVFAHELSHVRRGDLIVNVVASVLAPCWWFHPLFWIVFAELRKAQEDCSDDTAVVITDARRESYCELLLQAARLSLPGASTPSRLALGSSAALGGSALGRRFRRLMDGKLPRPKRLARSSLLVLIALAAILLPGWTYPDSSPPSEPLTVVVVHHGGHGDGHRHQH